MTIDNSSGAMPTTAPETPTAEGNTWRGIGSDLFNKNNVAKEDFARQMQIAEYTNKYNEYLSSTQYQRAVADMKKAGLNPLLAYSQGGNSATASSGSASAGSGTSPGDNALLKVMAGLVSKAIDFGLATQMTKSGPRGDFAKTAYMAKNPEATKQAIGFATGQKAPVPVKTVTRYYK